MWPAGLGDLCSVRWQRSRPIAEPRLSLRLQYIAHYLEEPDVSGLPPMPEWA